MKYILYAKYDNLSASEFIVDVVNHYKEAAQIIKSYSPFVKDIKIVPVQQIFKNCKTFDEQIGKILIDLGVDNSHYSRQDSEFSITIAGDWKHNHQHCDYIITKLFECIIVNENIIWNDGSDSYISEHIYNLKTKKETI